MRTQSTVNLIGRYMMEQMRRRRIVAVQPVLTSRHQQVVRADHIRLDESVRLMNRTIDVRLRSKMHDGVDVSSAHYRIDHGGVENIAVYEQVVLSVGNGFKIGKIARVGERIQHDDMIAWIPVAPVAHEVRADKPGSAGHEHLARSRHSGSASLSTVSRYSP